MFNQYLNERTKCFVLLPIGIDLNTISFQQEYPNNINSLLKFVNQAWWHMPIIPALGRLG
jgi:hypothetical protein